MSHQNNKKIHCFQAINHHSLSSCKCLLDIHCFSLFTEEKIKKKPPSRTTSVGKLLNVFYKDLHQATSGLSKSTLIGFGSFSSVYMGFLDQLERHVAIKVLNLQNMGALRSFLTECKTLGNIRHWNLVKILTYCSTLKPGNVLPDNNMITNVSDFGVPKIISTIDDFSQSLTSTTTVKGTIGYTAPEYGVGSEASKEGDIYSYDILVLEMFSGRRPINEMFKDGLNLRDFIHMAMPQRLEHIVDAVLLETEATGEATS